MGFTDIARSSAVLRMFIAKHFLTATGEDQDDKLRMNSTATDQETWEQEMARIRANLSRNGINWDDTKDPFITVNGTAQVSKGFVHF